MENNTNCAFFLRYLVISLLFSAASCQECEGHCPMAGPVSGWDRSCNIVSTGCGNIPVQGDTPTAPVGVRFQDYFYYVGNGLFTLATNITWQLPENATGLTGFVVRLDGTFPTRYDCKQITFPALSNNSINFKSAVTFTLRCWTDLSMYSRYTIKVTSLDSGQSVQQQHIPSPSVSEFRQLMNCQSGQYDTGLRRKWLLSTPTAEPDGNRVVVVFQVHPADCGIYDVGLNSYELREVSRSVSVITNATSGSISYTFENVKPGRYRAGVLVIDGEYFERVRSIVSEEFVVLKDFCGEKVVLVDDFPVTFSSPNHPNNYPANLDCGWEFRSTRKSQMSIEIHNFQTEIRNDVLTFEGSTLYENRSSQFSMHGATKVCSIIFHSSSVYVNFTSDSNTEFLGFQLLLHTNISTTDDASCGRYNNSGFNCNDGSYVSQDAECNGFTDCVSGLDESYCVNINCPDDYHCRHFNQCVFWEAVCDGNIDCLYKDDEDDCETNRCPTDCVCRYSGKKFQVRCLHGWDHNTIIKTAQITQALELTDGNLSRIEPGIFKGLSYLEELIVVAGNIQTIEQQTLNGLTNLTLLMMMDVPLTVISSRAFIGLDHLKTLVIITTPNVSLEVVGGAFEGLPSLQKVYVDDYLMCCKFPELDGFSANEDCYTTELSPPLNLCGRLLQSSILRTVVWGLAFTTLIGNTAVIVWRLRHSDAGGKKTLSHIVINLAVSDFFMGLYLVTIASADLAYDDSYSNEATDWRSSALCKLAGVVSVLSSEASVFFVTVISIDCFLGIVFPLRRLSLSEKSAKIVIGSVWIVAICLSVIPTVSLRTNSDVYGLSDFCIGLPLITKASGVSFLQKSIDSSLRSRILHIPTATGQKPAWIMSIVVFLGVNLVSFLTVLFCYVAIFVSVKRTSNMVRVSAHRDREIKMAIKMALIVMTDFFCWMPVIIMGILSQTNTAQISPSVYAWVVVFILPINSALNPFLYTFYSLLFGSSPRSNANRPPAARKPRREIDVPMSAIKP